MDRPKCSEFWFTQNCWVSKDHVHLLISAPPTMAPSEIMRLIKGMAARKLFEEFPMLRKRYWGQHFCGRGVLLCDGRSSNRGDDQGVFGASF